jgi:hypothetical protein
MTWDHIATAVVGGGMSLALGLALALPIVLVPALRRSGAFIASTFTAWLAVSVMFFAIAANDNMGAETAEYPGLVDAFELATPSQQREMRKVIAEAWRRREVFSMSRAQRDRYLLAGGYCLAGAANGCRPVPAGSAAQGEAIETMPNLGTDRHRPVHREHAAWSGY